MSEATEERQLVAYTTEAIDTLEAMIWKVEDDLEAGASFVYSTNISTGKKGKALKGAWIPRSVGQIISNGYRHVALLVGTVRKRDKRIQALEEALEAAGVPVPAAPKEET